MASQSIPLLNEYPQHAHTFTSHTCQSHTPYIDNPRFDHTKKCFFLNKFYEIHNWILWIHIYDNEETLDTILEFEVDSVGRRTDGSDEEDEVDLGDNGETRESDGDHGDGEESLNHCHRVEKDSTLMKPTTSRST